MQHKCRRKAKYFTRELQSDSESELELKSCHFYRNAIMSTLRPSRTPALTPTLAVQDSDKSIALARSCRLAICSGASARCWRN